MIIAAFMCFKVFFCLFLEGTNLLADIQIAFDFIIFRIIKHMGQIYHIPLP